MKRVIVATIVLGVCSAPLMPDESANAAPRCYAPARYHVAGGLVIDGFTGLTWQQTVSPQPLTWNDANTYCGTLGGNFRLPTLKELQSIVDYAKIPPGPTINAVAFPNTPGGGFWSSSPLVGSSSLAWIVFFDYGSTNYVGVTSVYQVRCVR